MHFAYDAEESADIFASRVILRDFSATLGYDANILLDSLRHINESRLHELLAKVPWRASGQYLDEKMTDWTAQSVIVNCCYLGF